MTPWVPGADEQLHVTGTDSLEDFYASSVAAYPRLSWVQGRTADGEVLSAAMARSPHALVGGGTGSGKSFWASWLLTSWCAGWRRCHDCRRQGQLSLRAARSAPAQRCHVDPD